MFNRRRRSTGSTASDQPFCAMCGQSIRVDVSTGRCALGHRVLVAVAAAAAPADAPAGPDLTTPAEPLGGYVDERIAAFTAERTYDPYAELADQAPVWDTAEEPTQTVGALEDFMAWDDEADSATSALDFSDTAEIPVVAPAAAAPVATPPADLLDELGDTPSYASDLA